MRERNSLEKKLADLKAFSTQLDDILLIEMGEDEGDTETISEQEDALKHLSMEVNKQQLVTLLSGEADTNDCFPRNTCGCRGTEAQDWAEMLLRMYVRWCDQRNFSVEYMEESTGEEAGLKSVTIKILGENAYGWLKTEWCSPFSKNITF